MARKNKKDRVGDVLGLGNTPASPIIGSGSIAGESDQARRQHRMNEGADELTPTATTTTPPRTSGATGIDMGSGGEGTDLE
jgi:hypothetical protein